MAGEADSSKTVKAGDARFRCLGFIFKSRGRHQPCLSGKEGDGGGSGELIRFVLFKIFCPRCGQCIGRGITDRRPGEQFGHGEGIQEKN